MPHVLLVRNAASKWARVPWLAHLGSTDIVGYGEESRGLVAQGYFAVIDTETTGLFPESHDRIAEIAVVTLDRSGVVLDSVGNTGQPPTGSWKTIHPRDSRKGHPQCSALQGHRGGTSLAPFGNHRGGPQPWIRLALPQSRVPAGKTDTAGFLPATRPLHHANGA